MEQGLRNIENIVAGDRILSRDLATGELGWRPALQRTTRPATDTVRTRPIALALNHHQGQG